MQHDLRIGEVARRTGRSVHTIRWYESQGLLPSIIRDAGGRRVYSEYHVSWLDLMERLRCTGMSIRLMWEFARFANQGDDTLAQRRALLDLHQVHVRDSIARWTEALALIAAKIEFYDEWISGGERPAVEPHKRLS